MAANVGASQIDVPESENRHICAFFNGMEEHYRVLAPFVKDVNAPRLRTRPTSGSLRAYEIRASGF